MYKVLVVDDEPLMLEGWKTMIDWQSFGFELCGTATDGEEALSAIKAMEPDLVVTDIRMPVLDGIGLIRAMREELGIATEAVIVSGYAEFSYAQQALRYKVQHYVLKPLVTEEIHHLLLELTGTLEKRRLATASVGKEEAAATAALLADLLKNGGQAAAERIAGLLGVNLQTRCRLLIAELHPSPENLTAAEVERSTVHARLREIVEASFKGKLRAYPFEDMTNRVGLLIYDEELADEQFESRLKETAAMLEWPLRELSLYCSRVGCGLAEVPKLYRQTLETRSRAHLGRRTGVHFYREHASISQCRLEDMTSFAGTLLGAIEDGDVEAIGKAIDSLVHLIERTGAREGWVQAAIMHLRGEMLRKYAGPSSSPTDGLGWIRQLLGENDFVDMTFWSGDKLKQLCIQAAKLLAERKAPDLFNQTVIAEAVAFLKCHFRERIQLQDLAERFHLNPVYFGQKFKKETGVSFNDYIHQLRIDEAQKLLRRTDMKVSDIALTLGYHDTEYFTNKFKAFTGELPSTYKNKYKGDRVAIQTFDYS